MGDLSDERELQMRSSDVSDSGFDKNLVGSGFEK